MHIHTCMCSPKDSMRLAGRHQHSKSSCSNTELWIDHLCMEPTLHPGSKPCSSPALVQAVPEKDSKFFLAFWGGSLLSFLALLQSHQEFRSCLLSPPFPPTRLSYLYQWQCPCCGTAAAPHSQTLSPAVITWCSLGCRPGECWKGNPPSSPGNCGFL